MKALLTRVNWRFHTMMATTIAFAGASGLLSLLVGSLAPFALIGVYLPVMVLLFPWRDFLERSASGDVSAETCPVASFRGEYRFLSNFWQAPAMYDGVEYPTAEHAYQAGKSTDPAVREQIRNAATPGEAKKLGALIDVRPDWTLGRDVEVMSAVVASKFSEDPELADMLLATGDRLLIEGNHWHDNNWGSCHCGEPACQEPGRNKLGTILMTVRAAL